MALLRNPLIVLLVATVAWAVPKGASVGNIHAAQSYKLLYQSDVSSR